MPTIFRIANYRVMILTNDHPPPHVHVIGPEGRAKIQLDCQNGVVDLLWHDGVQRTELRVILATVEAEIKRLCDVWRVIHGQN